MISIRDASRADVAAILPIHNHAVLATTAVWNEGASDLAGREAIHSVRLLDRALS